MIKKRERTPFVGVLHLNINILVYLQQRVEWNTIQSCQIYSVKYIVSHWVESKV